MSRTAKPAHPAAETRATARTVRCPTCGGDSVYAPANPWRPFCSERCRQIDLGAWASESFRVEATPPSDDPELEQ
jgi:endogenous inhibitor of DNA gyrase (YacG/DUF329 family)